LAGNSVNGSGNGARSGAQALLLLAAPLNVLVLNALADGPKQQAELRQAGGFPAQTTLRVQLKRLGELGAIEKRRRDRFPGVLEYELNASGLELLFVAEVLQHWLDQAPDGPLQLGGNAAKAVIKALADAWSTTMLRALAAGPLSLTALDGIIGGLSYPALERRLAAMRLAGQVERRSGNGAGTPYAVTDWLRRGVAPLAAAVRWERRHRPQVTAPIGRLDIEAAFLLAMPLLRVPNGASGSCRMAAEIANGKGRRLAGVMIELENGAVASCVTKLDGDPNSWALGSPAAWLDAVIERDASRLELGGDCSLARVLVDALHQMLFVKVQKSHLTWSS
jgi:DNA-binding HxlR family transcriptional regulator